MKDLFIILLLLMTLFVLGADPGSKLILRILQFEGSIIFNVCSDEIVVKL